MKANLTVYELATGKIVQSMQGVRRMLKLTEDHLDSTLYGCIWAASNPQTQCVESGEIVEITLTEAERRAQRLDQARAQRNAYLNATDWTQVQDAPVNSQAWANWREQLRQIEQLADESGEVTWPQKPQPTFNDRVNAERNRRLMQGSQFLIDGKNIAFRNAGKEPGNLDKLVSRATIRQSLGDATLTRYKDSNNVIHELTSQNLIDLGLATADWVEAVVQASWDIKEMSPETDVTDDTLWP